MSRLKNGIIPSVNISSSALTKIQPTAPASCEHAASLHHESYTCNRHVPACALMCTTLILLTDAEEIGTQRAMYTLHEGGGVGWMQWHTRARWKVLCLCAERQTIACFAFVTNVHFPRTAITTAPADRGFVHRSKRDQCARGSQPNP